jgi:hypothetical protein
MNDVMQNCVFELVYRSEKIYADPFNDVSVNMVVTCPDGSKKDIVGFWDGGNTWRLRFSSQNIGAYCFITVCSDSSNKKLHNHKGDFNIIPYVGSNSLYIHGQVKASSNKKYLEHADSKPFFWLGDTWWMGFTSRLTWPKDFKLLTSDRVQKGFNVIQIIAGLYPDMDWQDPRGANEAGFPWDKDFSSINPEYFRVADKKIAWLCNNGLMPCIVACWGYFAKFAGTDVIKRHWEYLIARWGAYPVTWCMAGEAIMPFYNDKEAHENMEEYIKKAKKDWTEITRYVKSKDPYARLITIHPTDFGHNMLEDETLINLNMMQTGHSSYKSFVPTLRMTKEAAERHPHHPFINSEVCYEGICGSSYADVQRFVFWSCILNGACGHTYGANGIWQMNSIDKPYGPSPHGATWGDTPWQEAYKLPGSKQIGLGKKFLERFEWWKFETHPEWIKSEDMGEYGLGYASSGIPKQVRVIFLHFNECSLWGGLTVKALEADVKYRAYWFNPVTGGEDDLGVVIPDENQSFTTNKPKILQDFILVLVKV